MNNNHICLTTAEMSGVTILSILRERLRPSIPIKEDPLLESINGPEYSITLSYLVNYSALSEDKSFQKYFCSDIIDYVLDMGDFTEPSRSHKSKNTDNDYKLVNINSPQYMLLRIHILEAADCFKFAVSKGYPYHYDKSEYKNEKRYANLESITRLFYIDSRETSDFIRYYFGLFPEISRDTDAIKYMIKLSIERAIKIEDIDLKTLRYVLTVFKILGISIDCVYYDAAIDTMLMGYDYDDMYDDLFELIQFGIANGIKLSEANIARITKMHFGKETGIELVAN